MQVSRSALDSLHTQQIFFFGCPPAAEAAAADPAAVAEGEDASVEAGELVNVDSEAPISNKQEDILAEKKKNFCGSFLFFLVSLFPQKLK